MLHTAMTGHRASRRLGGSLTIAVSALAIVLSACVPPAPPSAPSPLLRSPAAVGSLPQISADGSTVVVETRVPDIPGGAIGVIAIDVDSGTHEANPTVEDCPNAILSSVSPTGRWVAYVCYRSDPDSGPFRSAATLWDRETGTVTSLPGAPDGSEAFVSALSVGEGGAVALRCSGNCGVLGGDANTWVWDSTAGTLTPAPLGDDGDTVDTIGGLLGVRPELNSSATSVLVRSQAVNVTERATNCELLWDLPAGEWVGAGPEAANTCSPAVSRDHRHFAGFDVAAGTLWVHDRQTGTTAVRSDAPRGRVSTSVVAVSDDGTKVWLHLRNAAGLTPGRLVVWDLPTSTTAVPAGAPVDANIVQVDATATRGVAVSPDRRVWLLTI